MKRILPLVLILVFLLSVTNVYAYGGVTHYMTCNKTYTKMISESLPDDYIIINKSNCDFIQLNNNWYIVEESCTIGQAPIGPFQPGGVRINGEVHIVIGDGVTLSVQGGFGTEHPGSRQGELHVHGVQYGNCNLEIQGMFADKAVIDGFHNCAFGPGIDLKEFSVYGCNVTITGATGAKGVAPLDACGKDGYAAIENTNVNIFNSTIKAYGGQGGDSGSKRALQGPNNGGNGACAIKSCEVDLVSGTLELYGGEGGKKLVGSGGNGYPGDSKKSSSVHAKNASVRNADTGENINLGDIQDYQSVIITTNNLTVATIISDASPIIVVLVLLIIVAALIIVIKRKKSRA